MNRAVFLDRDGTIIKDRGHINYVKDIVFYNFTFDCLIELQKYFLLFIVTNQPGVSKDVIKVADLEKIHLYILQKLGEHGINIKEIYCCIHKKEELCSCRKPNTFFINSAREKYAIDLENSFIIGDHPSDVALAVNSKAKGIFLLTGHGQKHYHELNFQLRQNIRICSNLKAATQTILKSINNGS
jgi:D-glycero-D-manno-heptose 1,7-bisphosphate phosphatase